jgi:hypothetical protein
LPEFALIVEAEGLLLAWLFGYFLCRMQESGGPVARACDPSTSPDRRFPGLDLLVAPVEASGGSPCLWAAYLSMLLAGAASGAADHLALRGRRPVSTRSERPLPPARRVPALRERPA